MSEMKPCWLGNLPDDILYDIVACLPVRDIVRLRQVCKQLLHITLQRTVWSEVYQKSPLLRPPGPFCSQSAKDLESLLIQTEKLEINWNSPNPKPVLLRSIEQGLKGPTSLTLLLGRWLLAGDRLGLRCYDLDTKEDWSIPVAHAGMPLKVRGLESQVNTNQEGLHTAFVVIHEMRNSIKIFKVHLPPSSIRFELVLERHWQDNGSMAVNIGGDFLVVTSTSETLLMNIHTYQIYDPPPEPHCGPATNVGARQFYVECVLTETHMIIFYVLPGREVWIEAFTLPSDATPMISRSHTAHCSYWFTNATLIQSSVTLKDSSIPQHNISLLVSKGINGPGQNNSELVVLGLTLLPNETISVNTVLTSTLDVVLFNLCTSTSRGAARAVSQGSARSGTKMLAYTISDCATNGVKIRSNKMEHIGEPFGIQHYAFDGCRGRLCASDGLGDPTIAIYDFV